MLEIHFYVVRSARHASNLMFDTADAPQGYLHGRHPSSSRHPVRLGEVGKKLGSARVRWIGEVIQSLIRTEGAVGRKRWEAPQRRGV